ncbi:unnamed protein product, partial [marine sediment metagenome]
VLIAASVSVNAGGLFFSSLKKHEILERVGDISQLCDAREMMYTEGKSDGVQAIEVNTCSGFAFTVLPSRGLDIPRASYNGIPLAWQSETGVTSPFLFQPEGLEFLYSFFGGLLTTCGLTYAMHPCIDEDRELGIHGRISNTPAYDVNIDKYWEGDDYIIRISGKVREAYVHGDNLILHRSITTKLGSSKLLVEDVVENAGYQKSPLMMLYHVNAGWPVVSENSKLISPAAKVVPRDDEAKVEAEKFAEFMSPQKDFAERVYFIDMIPDSKGKVTLGIVNEKMEIG